MNTNTREITEIVPCNNLVSSHRQSLMSVMLHFLTPRHDTFPTRCLET